MKRFLVPLAVLALAACTSPTTGTSTSPAASLQQFTLTDLTAAAADATANNDTIAAQCWNGLIPIVQALPQPTSLVPTTPGLASAFQKARDAVNTTGNTLSPATQTKIAQACGPLAFDTQAFFAKVGLALLPLK